MPKDKNIFVGYGLKAQFVHLIYQELMKREFVSLADILCIYYDKDTDYYKHHSCNSEP